MLGQIELSVPYQCQSWLEDLFLNYILIQEKIRCIRESSRTHTKSLALGRLKKYTTTQGASNARKQRDRDRDLHNRQSQAPPALLHEPVLPSTVPTETPADIRLRIRPVIPILRETAEQCGETLREPPQATEYGNCDKAIFFRQRRARILRSFKSTIKRAAEAEETKLDLGNTQAEADSFQDYAKEEEKEEEEEECCRRSKLLFSD
ncbi:hypothetical protein IQ07DRAFT_606623 [Pyrenochaeta sp. DS3sAY3a]|nr:hypothetical protein IQ07DRAFT_606623 [Pyrenochaeta sp. DS3sAY3a]